VANLLRQGFVVVSDRSVVSSLAYQTAATKRRDWVREVNRYALKPDIVVYIGLSPEIALKRLGRKRYRYEKASFLQKVSKEYDRILRAGWRVVRVDGDQPVDDVFKDIAAGVERYLRKLSG
jgi:dTMP kinase